MAVTTAIQEAIGASQEAFRDAAQAKREELIATGQCEPCTIVNFNPVGMGLQGELQRYRVPSPHDERLPKDVLRITLPFDGKDRVGHCMTVRDPHVYGKNVNATWHQGGGPGDAIIQREPMYYLPVAIGYIFLEHYSPIFVTEKDGRAAAPPKDARKFYGVLCFRGDIHTLEKVLEEQSPERRMIHVPLAVVRQVGKIQTRTYRWVPTSLDAYLDRMFSGQLKFADTIISRAQQKWNGTDEDRKDISASDRIWYRWAINLGYADAPKPGEKTWLNELLTLNMGQGGDSTGGRRKCQSCRQLEPEPGTPFCPKCNAPINTFTTFMAGYPVAEAWLMATRGEERELILEELALRRQGFETAAGAPERSRGPYKQGATAPSEKDKKKKKGEKDDIPVADTTNLPGEEDE